MLPVFPLEGFQMNQPLRSFLDGRDGSMIFSVEKHSILFSLRRITDKKEIKQVKQEHDLIDKPPNKYSIRKYGFIIRANCEKVEIFRNDVYPISEGKKTWLVNLGKSSSRTDVIYAIALKVSLAHVPKETDFKTQAQIDAAFSWYRDAVERAEAELRSELRRIYSQT